MTRARISARYVALCKAESDAIAAASLRLLQEQVADGGGWSPERIDRRRAALYREHLDAAGIAIVRRVRP